MRLTKQTGYAIRILTAAARTPDVNVKIADFADELGITKQNALKIVNQMVHAGFIAATRGRSGGIMLALPADQIRIGDVVRAMEVTDVAVAGEAVAPARRRQSAGSAQPSLNGVFDDALEAFIAVLDQHTVADMAASRSAGPAGRSGMAKRPGKARKLPRVRSAVMVAAAVRRARASDAG